MKIQLDTNIILDVALKRDPYYDGSFNITNKTDNIEMIGFVSATTLTDIYYLVRNKKGHKTAIDFIRDLIKIVEITEVNKETILKALNSPIVDFEDAVQSACAKLNNMDYIITRNIKDFIQSEIQAITPTDFLEKIKP